jgi:hypothetical protein
MKQMQSYTTFLTEKGDLVIVIPFISNSSAIGAKILYDGKEHALFFRRPNEVIVLDYLNEAAQIVLKQAGKVLLFEVDINKQSIVTDYFVPVIITEKLPNIELSETIPNEEIQTA